MTDDDIKAFWEAAESRARVLAKMVELAERLSVGRPRPEVLADIDKAIDADHRMQLQRGPTAR